MMKNTAVPIPKQSTNLDTLPFILEALKPYRVYFVGCLSVVCLSALSIKLNPYLIKLFIDTVTGTTKHDIWALLGIYALLQIFTELLWIFSDWLHLKFVPAFKVHVASLMYQKIEHYSYRFFQNNMSGNITAKIDDAFQNVQFVLFKINYRFFHFFLRVLL